MRLASYRCFWRYFFVFVCGLGPVWDAFAAPVTARVSKDYRALVVKGERPEIAACLVAALTAIRTDPSYDALRWSDEESDGARMLEQERAGRLIRETRLHVLVRLRKPALFSDAWQAAEARCVQDILTEPQVQFRPLRSG